ncbi:hypothetical protein DFJ63DRAFT_313855 [Scheffersomyces coipomensis]|uniref:uncharacterized protein n=1 Tax=Scheffersomyces coipomensis TaxID=1788519 RepID=UPI00315CC9EB
MVKFYRAKFYQLVASFEFKVLACLFLGYLLINGISIYTSSFNGATCAYVKNDESATGLAEIAVRLNVLNVNENYDATTLKFPVLLFKYTDRENFTNIPTLDEFRKYYKSDDIEFGDDLIDSDHKFRLDVAKGKTLNEEELYNDYVMLYNSSFKGEPHMRASFKVKRSGLYCAYIATPAIDGPKRIIKLGIAFKNSFGDLSYYSHLLSSQMKYFVAIGSVLAVYFQFYTQRFRNQRDSEAGSKLIPVTIIRLVTMKVFLDMFSLICFYASNYENIFNALFDLVSHWNSILNLLTYCFIYSIVSVYGPLCAITTKFDFNDPVPRIWGILSALGVLLTEEFRDTFKNSYTARLFSDKETDLLFISSQLVPIVWKVFIVASFRRTKKAMLINNDTQYLKPLKHSLAFLIISPIIFTALTSFVFKTSFMQVLLFNPLYDIPATIKSFKVVYFDLVNTSVTEVAKLDPNLNLASIWSKQLTIYANAIFLFFMWIKNNKGLSYVVEDFEAKYEPLDGDVNESEEEEAEEIHA